MSLAYLVLVVVLPVEHHGLEPVSPEDLPRQVGRPRLECHARRLDRALQRHVDLELVLGELRGGHAVEGALLVDLVDDGGGPEEEDARLLGAVGLDLDRGDVVEHLALLGDAAADQLGGDLGADDVGAGAHVADAEDEAELLVALADDGVLAEDHRAGPVEISGGDGVRILEGKRFVYRAQTCA